jgi:flagellar biosynthesis protein FliQ
MKSHMEINRRTWIAAIKLAVVISTLAAIMAVAVSSLGDIPQAVIVLPVVIVAFTASWVQTGRVRDSQLTAPISLQTH